MLPIPRPYIPRKLEYEYNEHYFNEGIVTSLRRSLDRDAHVSFLWYGVFIHYFPCDEGYGIMPEYSDVGNHRIHFYTMFDALTFTSAFIAGLATNTATFEQLLGAFKDFLCGKAAANASRQAVGFLAVGKEVRLYHCKPVNGLLSVKQMPIDVEKFTTWQGRALHSLSAEDIAEVHDAMVLCKNMSQSF
ncbi:hypothetical protein BOTBODRAFT_189451 [Botryobasidium botryosum FD-172 SS1]|uniref:Uncharacterized protein n=1 Tax=Botryobasidium botryosum (strain FD-172 SS1) TaxID=930990 RepID=A0A067MBY3_BOTB1|nr:hypothetical protein BOTBODRAFT_189451 [Botryobasidium botryosum FD-172 SS1]